MCSRRKRAKATERSLLLDANEARQTFYKIVIYYSCYGSRYGNTNDPTITKIPVGLLKDTIANKQYKGIDPRMRVGL